MTQEKELITITEYARRRNTTRATVYVMIADGRIATEGEPPQIDYSKYKDVPFKARRNHQEYGRMRIRKIVQALPKQTNEDKRRLLQELETLKTKNKNRGHENTKG